jgi:chaperonin GroES
MVIPVGDQVLVRVDGVEEVSAGGLFIPVAARTVQDCGVVEGLGDSSVIKGIKVGDKVVIERGMGRLFDEVDGVGYCLVSFYDVLAVLQ